MSKGENWTDGAVQKKRRADKTANRRDCPNETGVGVGSLRKHQRDPENYCGTLRPGATPSVVTDTLQLHPKGEEKILKEMMTKTFQNLIKIIKTPKLFRNMKKSTLKQIINQT